jgi:putative transposase
MKRLQAYKFELKENGEQARLMRCFAGACRFVFNKALSQQEENYKADGRFASYERMASWLIEWKATADTSWLRQAPAQALQQALMNLDKSYRRFFDKKAAHPKFKRRGQNDSFRFPQSFKIDQAHCRVCLPKLGWIHYRRSREVLGKVRNVTVSQSAGKWFVSIQTELEVKQRVPRVTSAVGIDLGIARFATLSDGSTIAPLNSFKKHQQRLARYQRVMARKQKFSRNWARAKAKVQKIHAAIANARRHFLNKTSRAISKNHAMVCIEDLKVRNMSRSAAGTVDQPGKNVKAKSGLNRSILDQGWSEFRRQLQYKLLWRGGVMVAVPPQNTSQRCSCCGHTEAANRTSQARFECVECGVALNADFNAARNILAAGHAVLACGEKVKSRRSTKQEPAEATMQGLALT